MSVWICDGKHDKEIARFVLEADDFVNDLVVGARDELRILTDRAYLGFAAAVTAAGKDGKALLPAIQAIYQHLRDDYHLVYEFERGFDPNTGEQRIRYPADVQRHNGGTCIDLVLLFLSCLASAKLRTIYLQIRGATGGHALAGVWLQEPPLASERFLILYDLAALRKRIDSGQLMVLECTGVSAGFDEKQPQGLSFAGARDQATKMLTSLPPAQFGFALDVQQAWEAGFYNAAALRSPAPITSDASPHDAPVPNGLRDCFRFPFNTYMVSRTRGFVGRDFVYRALDDFLARERSGCFVIRGQPGIGKTALLAQLIKTRGYLHHFNISLQQIDTPKDFLQHACAQLIVRFQLPYTELPEEAHESGRFLGQLLDEAGRKLGAKDKLILAVDALDEVQVTSSAANILFLPPHLPDRCYLVVTTRPREQKDLTLRIEPIQDYVLKHDSEANLRDVRAYIQALLDGKGIQTWMTARNLAAADFVELLFHHSQGNFMYLHHVLPAIDRGEFHDFGLEELPNGLAKYYAHHWRQMQKDDPDVFDRLYQPVICVLAAAREAISVDQVADFTGLTPAQVRRVLGEWREFLDEQRGKERERLFRLYHNTFRMYLQEEVDPGLTTYHTLIARSILRKAGK